MAGPKNDTAANSPLPAGGTAAVPDPEAPRSDPEDGGRPASERDPAEPPPALEGAPGPAEKEQTSGAAEKKLSTPGPEQREGAPAAAPPSEATDETLSIPEDTGDGAASLDSSQAREASFLVPVVSVDGPSSTVGSPTSDTAEGPADLTTRSAPPPATSRPEPAQEQGRASSALGGITAPPPPQQSRPAPAPSPGFRPYSETPVYSDSGGPVPTPPPAERPPSDQPCSGDWHLKTVDDLIAMDVPDVRIPRCVATWGACEIRGWLRGLGLEQYTEALLNNGICGRRLCLLTASNLPRMGVTDWEHIRAMTGSMRRLLSTADYVPYAWQLERPPPGPLTRALYLQTAWPTGPPGPSSAAYRHFLRRHGFLEVLLEMTNRPVVQLPQPQPAALYREIAAPTVPSPEEWRSRSATLEQ